MQCTNCGQECFSSDPEVVFRDEKTIICENCSVDFEQEEGKVRYRKEILPLLGIKFANQHPLPLPLKNGYMAIAMLDGVVLAVVDNGFATWKLNWRGDTYSGNYFRGHDHETYLEARANFLDRVEVSRESWYRMLVEKAQEDIKHISAA